MACSEFNRIRRHEKVDRGMVDYDEYSLLSRHIPLTIADDLEYADSGNSSDKMMYLEGSHDNLCYCDERCITFGDCCSDYTFVCPPSDCLVTQWNEWSTCVINNKIDKCGHGVRTRIRQIRQEARYGGAECPPVVEKTLCFKECFHENSDTTTVALLIDYQYSKIRETLSRDNVYWDLPEVAQKVAKLSYYCVTYEIGWVNRNCVDKKIISKLYSGNIICAECQPEAQLHRSTLRCASDLNDGDYGLWKLIGPPYCNGIWRRISRTDNCRCDQKFPGKDSYLLV
ncbi:unnamed protein product [Dracunculus medinensis]|uniref:SMB domain-containing protein n=1 Tax=Dracunculus medinensis TaxID=318479 RepID=A0A0N4UMK6_DRAME|nr:unnamed protein product [Dracunculus medinensis]